MSVMNIMQSGLLINALFYQVICVESLNEMKYKPGETESWNKYLEV